MRANFSAEYFAFFTIFAQNPVACAELPHSCLPLDSSAFQPITPRFPSMQKRSPPHNFSASSLMGYKRALEQGCVMRDLQHFRKIPALMENPRLFTQYPRMVADIMSDMFTVDGRPNQPVRKMIMSHAKQIGLMNLLKDGIKGATAL